LASSVSTSHDRIQRSNGNDTISGGSGNDEMWGGAGDDRMVDGSQYSNDTYDGFIIPLLTEAGPNGYDTVYDYGGTDRLDVSTLNRSEVRISWVDTAHDADVNRDALRVQEKGTGHTRDVMFFYNYFDNKGGTGRGVGAIEAIEYENVRDHRFPAPQG
jgi:Ca2+-binding RTX toxin-like protein